MGRERALAAYDSALRVLGWLAFAGILACALHDASQAFDSWYYHLPFAARLVGLLPESSYVFHPANQARYAGFALLAELLQGALWRLTGRAESANLVAFVSVPLVAWFLQRRWKVPLPVGMLGLFAIPLVQMHAPSCYVDLPGNAAASVLVLLVIDAYASREPLPASDVALALACGAIAANIKPLLQPAVGLCLLALLVRVSREPRTRRYAVVMVFASPLVLFTPLKNAVVHGNPFFPIGTHLLGLTLPGPEETLLVRPRVARALAAAAPLRCLAPRDRAASDGRPASMDRRPVDARGVGREPYRRLLSRVRGRVSGRLRPAHRPCDLATRARVSGGLRPLHDAHRVHAAVARAPLLHVVDDRPRVPRPGARVPDVSAAVFPRAPRSRRCRRDLVRHRRRVDPRGVRVSGRVHREGAGVREGRCGAPRQGEGRGARVRAEGAVQPAVERLFHAPRRYKVVEAEAAEDCLDTREVGAP